MKKSRIPLRIANGFGALGYLSCIIQWMLVFAILVLPLMEHEGVRDIFIPAHPAAPTPSGSLDLPPILQQALLVGATIFSVGIIVYAVAAIPRAVGKAGRKVTHEVAEVAVRQVEHIRPKPLTKTQHKTLAERFTWTIKLLLIVLPPLLLLIPVTLRYGLAREHVLIAGAFTASMSLLWFGIQYLVAYFTKLDQRDVW